MAQYLVTGGGGFIGSHLVRALLERGDAVRVFDNFSTGRRSNLADVASDVDVQVGSITDPAAVANAMRGVEYVLHQAAIPSVARSVEQPHECHENNVTGTLHVLDAARRAGVQKVVYAASSSAYGNAAVSPKHEALPPAPMSPYAAAKLAGEQYCRVWTQVYGLPTVALRYFNIFGPRQDPESLYAAVIPRFITRMLRGEAPTINGDGSQSRDFTYVANVVRANLLACAADERADGQVMNIACGEAYTLLELVAAINGILGTTIEPTHGPAQIGDVRHSLAAIERAHDIISYTPQVGFAEGLQRTVESLTHLVAVE